MSPHQQSGVKANILVLCIFPSTLPRFVTTCRFNITFQFDIRLSTRVYLVIDTKPHPDPKDLVANLNLLRLGLIRVLKAKGHLISSRRLNQVDTSTGRLTLSLNIPLHQYQSWTTDQLSVRCPLGFVNLPYLSKPYTDPNQRAWVHELPPKLAAAASSGLPGIEIFFEDLLYLASSYPDGATPANQLLAAHSMRQMCDSLNLEIMGIGPFNNCEGLLSPEAKAAKLVELQLWFKIARIVGTDLIQIPCTFMTEGVTGDVNIVARDLREIADIGAAQNPPFRFAYENLCWGTFNDTWDKAWEVVKTVDRKNFGMCLDTFNIAGRSYADPTSPTGKLPDAEKEFTASMQRMAREIDPSKVFYVQVVDAERLSRPLDTTHPFHVDGQKPRMSWSRNCRLFICEEERGGYLPVVECLKTICGDRESGGLGYKGWVSMELFNRTLIGDKPEVPAEHADRAMESWRRLVGVMGWEGRAAAAAAPAVEKSVPVVMSSGKSRSKTVEVAQVVEVSARL
jgi:4-hydroxyphenylpyruvate dioxygenase